MLRSPQENYAFNAQPALTRGLTSRTVGTRILLGASRGIDFNSNLLADRLRLIISQLHYARFLAGDGNFKLQRIARKRSNRVPHHVYESMLGDGAFWAPVKALVDHVKTTGPAVDEPKGKVPCAHQYTSQNPD